MEGANDFASLNEVLGRRFTHGLREKAEREAGKGKSKEGEGAGKYEVKRGGERWGEGRSGRRKNFFVKTGDLVDNAFLRGGMSLFFGRKRMSYQLLSTDFSTNLEKRAVC